ncbi:homocitrate synthase NifV [Orenia metallireducens]|uniref:Homocitrate synthase NifV n=1 Tax=Orenia metallireducens TaxID=1413210 RepID=A0A285GFK6_9FIRM|nr:homocitrate synthase [Orenia metallireducens]PRX30410.1 homocitrate synthase NifV [Orenia metallireducens]SNY22359.1 homocitrate synthase NifV [Orenia metallireducens]
MNSFYILDTTLRDGEQSAGVSFSKKEKIDIACKLDELGVDVIEAGIPAMGTEEKEVLKEIISLDLNAEILAWNRMKIEDIDQSLDCGFKNIHISAPASDIQLKHKLKKDRGWLLAELTKVINYAIKKGCMVSVGAEDASRADIDFLIQLYKVAQKEGAVRVRYADTIGALDPLATYDNIKKIREAIDLEVDFHGHNDFGMATANALSAFKAGAKYISCTVNGLGERAGNTALEEIVMSLKCIEGCESDFKIKGLKELSKLVEDSSGRRISIDKPVVGDGVFSHESGIHVDGLLKNPSTYEFLSPGDLGRERKFVIGKFSGVSSILHKYKELGISLSEDEANKVLRGIKSYSGNVESVIG